MHSVILDKLSPNVSLSKQAEGQMSKSGLYAIHAVSGKELPEPAVVESSLLDERKLLAEKWKAMTATYTEANQH